MDELTADLHRTPHPSHDPGSPASPSAQDAAGGILARLKAGSDVRPAAADTGAEPMGPDRFSGPPQPERGGSRGLKPDEDDDDCADITSRIARREGSARVRTAVAAVVLTLGIAGAAAWKFLPLSGQTVISAAEVHESRPSPTTGAETPLPSRGAGGTPGESAGTVIVVDVTGAVQHPGLLRLPPGSRVGDAVDKAGGPAADADLRRVNRAQRLSDGQQVLVPRRGESPAVASAAPTGSAGTANGRGETGAARVNVNAATSEELQTLPRVGPVLARRIIDEREAGGPYRSVEDLRRVKGLGASLLKALADRVDF